MALDNAYNGFQPDSSWTIDKISSSVSPNQLFDQFISQRKPVVLQGVLTDPEWKGNLWSNTYLKEKAGKLKVRVEQSDPENNFGTSLPRLKMTFSEFLDKISAGNENIYLTTQYDDDDDDDSHSSEEEPSEEEEDNPLLDSCRVAFPTPVMRLFGEFPIRPQLLGNLIPQQCNLWMGTSKKGSSSGLHHDFHENLYILLRGEKRFTIVCPSQAPNLYTHGKIVKIHPNGLINYEKNLTLADGVPELELVTFRIDKATSELDNLEPTKENENIIKDKKQSLKKDLELRNEIVKKEGNDDEDEDDEIKPKKKRTPKTKKNKKTIKKRKKKTKKRKKNPLISVG